LAWCWSAESADNDREPIEWPAGHGADPCTSAKHIFFIYKFFYFWVEMQMFLPCDQKTTRQIHVANDGLTIGYTI
jgi:hypothetical protein